MHVNCLGVFSGGRLPQHPHSAAHACGERRLLRRWCARGLHYRHHLRQPARPPALSCRRQVLFLPAQQRSGCDVVSYSCCLLGMSVLVAIGTSFCNLASARCNCCTPAMEAEEVEGSCCMNPDAVCGRKDLHEDVSKQLIPFSRHIVRALVRCETCCAKVAVLGGGRFLHKAAAAQCHMGPHRALRSGRLQRSFGLSCTGWTSTMEAPLRSLSQAESVLRDFLLHTVQNRKFKISLD